MLTLKNLKDLIQEKDRKFGMTTPCNRCGGVWTGKMHAHSSTST